MSEQSERRMARAVLDVTAGKSKYACVHHDSLAAMAGMPDSSVDLVLGSPPYEAARRYDELGFDKKGQAWVDWMLPYVTEATRISRGLAVFVIGHGKTSSYDWSGAPALLMADLIRRGISLRCPLIYARDGIFGSGGPDYFRYNYEWVLVAQAKPQRLAWCNNCAGARPPRYGPGGEASHRMSSGARVNQWGGSVGGEQDGPTGPRGKDGERRSKKKPSHTTGSPRKPSGQRETQDYRPPVLANPGCVFQETYTASELGDLMDYAEEAALSRHRVGGNQMGHPLAHENEAPYPLSLAERYVLSFCPPGGIVFDPFMGSGTTLHAAVENHRRAIGCDLRESQVKLAVRRMRTITPNLVVFSDQEYEQRMAAKEGERRKKDNPPQGEGSGVRPDVAGDAPGHPGGGARQAARGPSPEGSSARLRGHAGAGAPDA